MYARAAGTYAQLFKKDSDKGLVWFKLPAGKKLCNAEYSVAFFGRNSNILKKKEVVGKAGLSFLRGKLPIVRGVARNPVDHPNGGRTKSKSPEKSL